MYRLIILSFCSMFLSTTTIANEWHYFADIGYLKSTSTSDESLHSFYFSNGLLFYNDPMYFSLTVPFIYQNSGNLISVRNMHPRKGQGRFTEINSESNYEFGLGDFFLEVGSEVINESKNDFPFSMQLFSSLKIPIADEDSGLGSGEWDYSLGFSLNREINNLWYVSPSVSYWFIGNPPDQFLGDEVFYKLEVGRFYPEKSTILSSFLSLDHLKSGDQDPLMLGFSYRHQLIKKDTININFSLGLNDAAADFVFSLGRDFPL